MTLLPRPALLVSLALGLASLSLAPSALAGSECKADADCGAGFYCEIAPAPSVGCASEDGKPCAEPAPAPAPSTGYCREAPLTCTSDAQCPSYLSCVESGGDVSVGCAAPACPPGQECPVPECDTPAPSDPGPRVCAPKLIACETDSACPTGFACNLTIGGACSGSSCAPGQECDDEVVCEPETKACGPKEIECQADSQCPSDWRCLAFTEGGCSGGGGTDVPPSDRPDESVPQPAPAPGSKALDECTTTTRSLCVPKGYLAGIESGGSQIDDVATSTGSASGPRAPEYANGEAKGTGTPTYSAPQDASSSGSSGDGDGCSSSGRGQGSGLLGALLVGLASVVARRRR